MIRLSLAKFSSKREGGGSEFSYETTREPPLRQHFCVLALGFAAAAALRGATGCLATVAGGGAGVRGAVLRGRIMPMANPDYVRTPPPTPPTFTPAPAGRRCRSPPPPAIATQPRGLPPAAARVNRFISA
jgi:hypothetical protein